MIPKTDTTAYMVIANYYKQEILAGRITDRLPTTRQAAADWGVSRPTVDHAWKILKRDNFIVSGHTGAYVYLFRTISVQETT